MSNLLLLLIRPIYLSICIAVRSIPHTSIYISKSSCYWKLIGNQWDMFTVGPMTQGFDQGCSVANTEPTARQFKGKLSYLYALQEVSNQDDRIPRGTPGGSR